MVKLDLSNLNHLKLFDIPEDTVHKKQGWSPNIVMLDDTNKRLIIACYLSASGGEDYSLNEKALIDGVKAIDAGRRVVGYVAIAGMRVDLPEEHTFINWETVPNMMKRLRNVPTLEGLKFPGSRFWWIDRNMQPVINAPTKRRRSAATSM